MKAESKLKIRKDHQTDVWGIPVQYTDTGDEYITEGDRKQIKFIGWCNNYWDHFNIVVEIDGRRALATSYYFEMESK